MKLLLFLMLFSNSYASELSDIKWKEISNHDQIQVYIPKSYEHKSGLVPIRFKAVLKHPIERVLAVLADETRKMEWVPKANEVRILSKKSHTHFTVYYRYDAPWPFSDRDFIIQNVGKYDQEKQTIFVDLKSVDHPNDPNASGTVRGTTYSGYSIIKPLNQKETSVEMGLLTAFGGFIPKWIINLVQKKWPYKFMDNLKNQLKKDDIIIPEHFRPHKQMKWK